MGKFGFIDRIFGDSPDDEEIAANNVGFDDEDDEDRNEDDDTEEEEDDDGGDDENEAGEDEDGPTAVEDEAALKRLDVAFRALRAKVRASSDLVELRTLRADHLDSLAEPQSPTVRLRTQDIIEEIDERVTELRARRARRDS